MRIRMNFKSSETRTYRLRASEINKPRKGQSGPQKKTEGEKGKDVLAASVHNNFIPGRFLVSRIC